MKKEDDTLENCIQLCAKIYVVLLLEIKEIFHKVCFGLFWFDKIISLVTFLYLKQVTTDISSKYQV